MAEINGDIPQPENIPCSKEAALETEEQLSAAQAKINPQASDAEIVSALEDRKRLGAVRDALFDKAYDEATKENEQFDRQHNKSANSTQQAHASHGARGTSGFLQGFKDRLWSAKAYRGLRNTPAAPTLPDTQGPFLTDRGRLAVKDMLDPFRLFSSPSATEKAAKKQGSPFLTKRGKQAVKDVLDPFRLFTAPRK